MKQVTENFRTGEVSIEDVPAPGPQPGRVLVQTLASLISAGTENAALNFGKKNLVQKAASRPDLVRQVLNKIKTEGLLTAYKLAQARLDAPLALGYSSAGRVLEVGDVGVSAVKAGDLVACAGGGYAIHAGFTCVPKNLVVKLPPNVSAEHAAFTTIGSIALQGVRLADIKLGETVAVIGLGLLGQLTAQILAAAGCRVIGMDIQAQRAELARRFGLLGAATSSAEMSAVCGQLTEGRGVDAVLITADTQSHEPVVLAGDIARDRGVVVAVGAVGLEIPRRTYYEKELRLLVSRSYGPGRYDPDYEERGKDYPIGYVRWTENRNMEAFVDLLAAGRLNLDPLISHRFPLEEAEKAYELIGGKSGEPFLGVLFTYPETRPERRVELRVAPSAPSSSGSERGTMRVGLLGAGNFASAVLLPALRKVPGVDLAGICTASGLSAGHVGKKFGFRFATTEEDQIFDDPAINTVVIATRHSQHARQVVRALRQGKIVFCEKPLCLNDGELDEIRQAHAGSSRLLVGFNRRFAPLAQRLKDFLGFARPLMMHYRVNAGAVPPTHWIHDLGEGGGRIVGEACHFVDLLGFLAGSAPRRVFAAPLDDAVSPQKDSLILTLEFQNGSVGTIHYGSVGDRAFPKERVEVFGGGAVAVLEDFRRLETVRGGRRRVWRSRWKQDKGHEAEWTHFARAIESGGPSPIPFEEIVATTRATFRVLDSLSTGLPVEL